METSLKMKNKLLIGIPILFFLSLINNNWFVLLILYSFIVGLYLKFTTKKVDRKNLVSHKISRWKHF